MDKLDLDSIIKFVNELPSLPRLVTEIIQLTDDPKVTARDINEVLSRDQNWLSPSPVITPPNRLENTSNWPQSYTSPIQ